MSDTYGSGLTGFGVPDSAGGPSFAPEVPNAPNDGLAPTGPQGTQDAGPSFGSSLRNMLPGPHYAAPDPEMSPLDQTANTLSQRIKRANSVATNPLAQIFAPEQAAAARTFIPQAAEQLQKIEQQKSAIASGRLQARQLGLDPGEASDQATTEDRVTIAAGKALKGDMKSFQGLQAVAPERAAAIAPQVFETVGGHLEKAKFAFDSLASMQNEGQYAAKLSELRSDGTLADLESLGLKPPKTFDQFTASKASESRALREARIGIDSIRQRMEERNTYQPMEEKEAKTYNGRLTTAYGDQITNGTWGRNGASGTRGLVVNGAADPNDLGKKFTLATPDQRKEISEQFKSSVPITELEKIRSFDRTYRLAEPTAEQRKRGDVINTNPNVQQGIAEGLASMLRGGSGGATGQLLKIETGKRGVIQGIIDKVRTEYGGLFNTLSDKDVKPYLTHLTQTQQREVLDGLKQWNDASIDDRAKQVATRAGALGLTAAELGLGKDEASGVIGDALEAGRRAQIERMKPNHQAIGGGDGVLQLGAQRTGAGATALPPGTQNTNQLPQGGVLTPVQQAGTQNVPLVPSVPGGGQPAPPLQSSPMPDGGAGTPITVAGQSVSLPPGISPQYVGSLQRIESGSERNPWTAGTKNSSASGAFQFINSTWAENKPAGAPDKAKDATPQQQAQALGTLTEKNTASLRTLGLPVTDTSLYVMHNLGSGAGATLLQTKNMNADARSIVGETAARNNPTFFRGRPTVATVLQRYADAMNPPSDKGPKPQPGTGGATADGGLISRVNRTLSGNPTDDPAAAVFQNLTSEQQQQARQSAKESAIDAAPAIGSTVGALAGMVSPVPGGTALGGAVGGGAGQALKDYLQGRTQSPLEIAKQTALGGVLGVGGLPRGLNMAARAAGAGAVEAGADVVDKGEASPDTVDAAVRGTAETVGGEAFGRALGMVGHKVYSMFAPDARKVVQTAAKNYAESSEVLKTQEPKVTTATGSVANPEYVAAEVKRTKAETTLKDAGLNPEEAAYAHRVSSEGVPRQEAEAARPGVLEKDRVGAGYRQLEEEIAGPIRRSPKAQPKLVDGPIAAVESKQVSTTHRELADQIEMAITAPAKNWQAKWVQLKDERSKLLELERDALSSTAPGKSRIADDMRKLADTVRVQQEKAAKYVFGPKDGEAFIQRLKVLDTRYRRLMEATNSGDITAAARMKGEAGREVDRRFRAFAHDDPIALQAWSAMRKEGGNLEKDVKNLVAFERFPVLGKVYSAAKLAASFNTWMRERAAGNPAKFADFVKQGDGGAQTTRDVAGTIGARTAVQSDALNGAMQ